jgi:hypothetical protein
MKTHHYFPQKRSIVKLLLASMLVYGSCSTNTEASEQNPNTLQPQVAEMTNITNSKKKIKIALLLDTSSSMDGLIEQAKSQLWKFVNALSRCSYNEEKPELEIALYEYGNDGLPASEGHVRQVSGFTNDLDLVSEKLFALTTNGGNEFCGKVIQTSLDQLQWDGNDADLRVVFIAGNEPFNQGKIRYSTACAKAIEKQVVINTIYCGSFDEGISGDWKQGADLAGGNYMSIEQNRKTVFIDSPFDDQISHLNDRLNDTYISYGSLGIKKKMNQVSQDKNAESYGIAYKTERAVSKSSSFYSNSSWDLVDASNEKSFDLNKLSEADLPIELRKMSIAERQKFIEQKKQDRIRIQKQIRELNTKRDVYVLQKSSGKPVDGSLDLAMINALQKQAISKGFKFN